MKKIGLTTHYGDNYGACLQAFATQKFLEQLGFECSLIRYSPYSSQKKSFSHKLLDKFRLLTSPSRLRNGFRSRVLLKNRFQQRSAAFDYFRQQYLTIDQTNGKSYDDYYANPPQYDIYICGSDQLWNPTFYQRCNPVYYLDFVPQGKKRIAYSTSIGLTTIPEPFRLEMTTFLNRMSAISIRESRGAEIVKELTGRDVPVVVDPTFLLTADQWRQLGRNHRVEEPYLFLYLWGDLPYIDEFKNYVKQKTGLKTICLPYRPQEYFGQDQNIFNAGPEDFVHLIDEATLVVTDSFHATALAVNCKTPFYTLLRQPNQLATNMNSRFYSLLSKLKLENRLVLPDSTFPQQISLDLSFNDAHKTLNEWRLDSIAYLKNALEI